MGVKSGVNETTFLLVNSFMPNLTPIGAVCRPCGEKNLKIALLVTELNTRRPLGQRCRVAWWRNGRASDLRSRGREFDSRPGAAA